MGCQDQDSPCPGELIGENRGNQPFHTLRLFVVPTMGLITPRMVKAVLIAARRKKMTPRNRITTEDCMAAHAERLAENAQQLKQNRYWCEHMDRVEAANPEGDTR